MVETKWNVKYKAKRDTWWCHLSTNPHLHFSKKRRREKKLSHYLCVWCVRFSFNKLSSFIVTWLEYIHVSMVGFLVFSFCSTFRSQMCFFGIRLLFILLMEKQRSIRFSGPKIVGFEFLFQAFIQTRLKLLFFQHERVLYKTNFTSIRQGDGTSVRESKRRKEKH